MFMKGIFGFLGKSWGNKNRPNPLWYKGFGRFDITLARENRHVTNHVMCDVTITLR